jgi:hypothetical protein
LFEKISAFFANGSGCNRYPGSFFAMYYELKKPLANNTMVSRILSPIKIQAPVFFFFKISDTMAHKQEAMPKGTQRNIKRRATVIPELRSGIKRIILYVTTHLARSVTAAITLYPLIFFSVFFHLRPSSSVRVSSSGTSSPVSS